MWQKKKVGVNWEASSNCFSYICLGLIVGYFIKNYWVLRRELKEEDHGDVPGDSLGNME